MIKIEQDMGNIKFSSTLSKVNFKYIIKKIYGPDAIDMVKGRYVTVDVLYKAFLIVSLEEYIKTVRDRDVARELKELIRKLKTIKDKYTRKINPHIVLETMEWRPLGHQKNIFKEYIDKCTESGLRGILMRGDVGSGKTSMGLMLTKAMNTKHTVIIAPNNTVLSVWVKTIAYVGAFKKTPTYWTPKSKKPFNNEEYIVVNFESLHKVYDLLEKIGKYSLIIDESHNITADSKLSFTIRDIVERDTPKGIIMLSGTPIKMSFIELLPMLQILRVNNSRSLAIGQNVANMTEENKLKVAKLAYKSIEIRVKYDNGKNLRKNDITINVKIKNEHRYYVETLRQEMKDYIEMRKIEVEPKLDEYTKEWKSYVELSPAPKGDIKLYYKSVNWIRYRIGDRDALPEDITSYMKSIEDTVPVKGEEAKNFRSLCSLMKWPLLKFRGEALGRVLGKKRKELSLEMLDHIDLNKLISLEKEKVLIYSNYIDVAKKVERRANRHKGVRIYDGNARDVNSILHNTEFKFISTSYKSLSTGVPLIMCATTIFIEKPFRNYIMEQAMGRTDRLGQRNNITFIDFVLDTDKPNIYNRNNDLMKMSYVSSSFLVGDEIDKEYAKDVLDREEIAQYLESEMIEAESGLNPILENDVSDTNSDIRPMDDFTTNYIIGIDTLTNRDLDETELESVRGALQVGTYNRALWLMQNGKPQRRQELINDIQNTLVKRMETVKEVYLNRIRGLVVELPEKIVYGNTNIEDWMGCGYIGQLIQAHTPNENGMSLMEQRDSELDVIIDKLKTGVDDTHKITSLRVHVDNKHVYNEEQLIKFAEVYKPNQFKKKLVTIMELCISKLLAEKFIGCNNVVRCVLDVHKVLDSHYEPNSISVDELLEDFILITK